MRKPRERVWSFILNSVSERGCWNSDDFDEWAPVTTALTVDLLLRCGVEVYESWICGPPERSRDCSIEQCLVFLDASIRADGSFGEDIWDAAKFAETILRFGLRAKVPGSSRLLAYLEKCLEERAYAGREGTWDGPGTIATLVSYLIASGSRARAGDLIAELNALQASGGEFRGAVGSDGNDLASPVWHTAQVLAAFLEFGIPEKDERIQKMLRWLERTQASSGNWPGFSRYEIYYTAYAAIALSKLGAVPGDMLERAVEWLGSNVSTSGKVRDVGGPVMTATALCHVEGFSISGEFQGIAFHNFMRLEDKLRATEALLAAKTEGLQEAEREIGKFRARFGQADFGITKAQAFLWSLASLIVGVLLALIPPLATNAGRLANSTTQLTAPSTTVEVTKSQLNAGPSPRPGTVVQKPPPVR